MSPWTTTRVTMPHFVADHASINMLGSGRQIDWASVNAAFIDATTGKKRLPAGTVVAEASAGGKLVNNNAGVTPIGILISDAEEDHPAHAVTGYGVITGGNIYSNLLPTLAFGSNAVTNLNTGRFFFQTYADNRV
jgi:hypothetical protein